MGRVFPEWLITGVPGLVHVALSVILLPMSFFVFCRLVLDAARMRLESGFSDETSVLIASPAWPFAVAFLSLVNGMLLVVFFLPLFKPIYLSTTAPSARRLTRRNVLRFQQCRAVGLVLNSVLPLLFFADYMHLRSLRVLLLVLSAANMAVIVCNYDRWFAVFEYGLLPGVFSAVSLVLPVPDVCWEYLALECMFATFMIHWGFGWYALYTRHLVTKETARWWIGNVHKLIVRARQVLYILIPFWSLPYLCWIQPTKDFYFLLKDSIVLIIESTPFRYWLSSRGSNGPLTRSAEPCSFSSALDEDCLRRS